MKRILVAVLVVAGCAADSGPADDLGTAEQDATVCGVGPTVKGIDVSTYQGTINWTSVKNDGVKYAVIRVSDGLNSIDAKFASNWSGSRAAGVKHGAYQFFRPSQDPIAQADLLLSKIGNKIAADDLPPTIDVEASDGLGAAAVAAAVKKWVAHVKAKLGRDPIIYTGFYFWRDSVGDPNMSTSALWHAQYTSASCPTIAASWDTWSIWQYSSTGSVVGISGNVDMDRWNGDAASFNAFLGPATTCGDGTCDAGETKLGCPEDCGPCGTITASGGVVDDGDACFEGGGPSTSMRNVSTAGEDGDLVWTHTTEDTAEGNFATWHLNFAEAGTYRVEVFTDTSFAQSKQAKYTVEAGAAQQDVAIDQTAVNGWQSLGQFSFEAGGAQSVHLADNTGEPLAQNVQLVFDAVRLTRVDEGTGSGETPPPGDGGGCNAGGGGAGAGLVFALGLLVTGRRRR